MLWRRCCRARLQLVHGWYTYGARCCRSISSAHRALSSKPVRRCCCCRSIGRTDGQLDVRLFHRPRSAYCGPCQQVCVEPPRTSVLNMTLPAAAALAPAAIDRYLLPATELSSPTSLLLSIHWTDNGRTGGRTDTRPLHRRCTAFCANSVKKV